MVENIAIIAAYEHLTSTNLNLNYKFEKQYDLKSII